MTSENSLSQLALVSFASSLLLIHSQQQENSIVKPDVILFGTHQ